MSGIIFDTQGFELGHKVWEILNAMIAKFGTDNYSLDKKMGSRIKCLIPCISPHSLSRTGT